MRNWFGGSFSVYSFVGSVREYSSHPAISSLVIRSRKLVTIAVSFYIFQFPFDTNNSLWDCDVPPPPTIWGAKRGWGDTGGVCGCGRIQFQSTDKSKLVICSTAQCYMISTRRRRRILQHPPPPEMAVFFFYNYLIARRPTAVYSDCNLEYFVFTRLPDWRLIGKLNFFFRRFFLPFIAWVYQISVMVVDNVQYKARPSFYSLRERNEWINKRLLFTFTISGSGAGA